MNIGTDERLGSYSLGATIGKGAAGVVWSATSPDHDEPVAIKILRDDLTDDPKVVARFLREQQIFDAVDHPNVVKVYDLIAEDQLGIVMELLEGGDLRSLIASGELTVTDSIDIARQVADGLAYIHDVGVLHRDLKPANVLVGGSVGNRTVKISDFGVSRLVGDAMTRTSTTIGTPLYMAPEATGSSGADTHSDVYALGAMLYEMLVGSPPFHGEGTLAVILAHSQCPIPELHGIPSDVSELVVAMLDKAPPRRPSAADVAAQLVAVAPLVDDEMEPYATSPFVAAKSGSVLESEDLDEALAEPTMGIFDDVAPGEVAVRTGLLESELRTIAIRPEEEDEPADGPWPAAVNQPGSNSPYLADLVSRHLGAIVVSLVVLAALFTLAVVFRDDSAGTTESIAASDREVVTGPERTIGDESVRNRQASRSENSTPSEASSSSAGVSSAKSVSAKSSSAKSSDARSSSEASSGETAARTASSKTATPKKGAATRKGASGEQAATTVRSKSSATTSTKAPRSSATVAKSAVAADTSDESSTISTEAPTSTADASPSTSSPTLISAAPSTAPSTAPPTTEASAPTSEATAPTTASTSAAPPTTKAPLASTTTATTAAQPAGRQVAIVSGPSVVSVTSTSAVFRYTTNAVCATGGFTFRNQSTGAVVGRWVGDRGCFGPVHDGNTAWPNIVLEPGTTYSVSIVLEGQPSDGTLATGIGRTTSSIVITTPG